MQDQLISMPEWAKEGGATPEQLEVLLEPYRQLLDSLYENDLPFSQLADESGLPLQGSASDC